MTLKIIEIENIKGIKEYSFKLDILPNKPSILVAPNGFGKSSFATAFSSLQENGIHLDERSLHRNNNTNQPRLFIKYQKPDNTIVDLKADTSINTIKDEFDYFVISGQIGAKGTGTNYGSEMTINPVILISSIPEKAKFNYSLKAQQKAFGSNGKVLPNIKDVFNYTKLLEKINDNYAILDEALESNVQKRINDFIYELNQQSGTTFALYQWIESNKIDELIDIDCLKILSGLIGESSLILKSRVECFLSAIQIINLYGNDKLKFKEACIYKIYEIEKRYYKSTLESFNSSWKDIYIKESRGSLIVEFPNFYHISNGERDILTFISLLQQAKRNLRKDNNILIIDEVFDYLDDANLVSVQYYITQFINDYCIRGKRIYPLILTHLDPEYFKGFVFGNKKIYYLEKSEINVNPHLVRLLKIRGNKSLGDTLKDEIKNDIKDEISKYLFHYHSSCINRRQEFRDLSLKETWGEANNFDNFITAEIQKYLSEESDYNPFAVCCAVRKKIEKLVYSKITNSHDQEQFLTTHKTRDKLDFAKDIGVPIPETYYLLGIIYNDGLHWKGNQEGQDFPIASKLKNFTIKKLIKDIFD